MGILLLLLLTLSTAFSEIIIKSNYPLRKNNLEKLAKEGDLPLLLWALQNLRDIKDIQIKTSGKDTIVVVERYPILKEVEVEGNWFVGEDEIKNLLGLRENEPLIDFDRESSEDNLERFYREIGYLDANVNISVMDLGEGFVGIRVRVREGDLYFLGGIEFTGLEEAEPKALIVSSGLKIGEVFKESRARSAEEKFSQILRDMGYYENLVYFRGVQQRELRKPFWRVLLPLGEDTLKSKIASLFQGITTFITHPVATFKAIRGKGKVAVPMYHVVEGGRFSISFEGNRFFSDRELKSLILENVVGVDYFFLEGAREIIAKHYQSKGFFDVEVEYSYEDGEILFFIEEGERYGVSIEGDRIIEPPEFFDEELIHHSLEKWIAKKRKEGFLTAGVSLKKEIDRIGKVVRLEIKKRKGKKVIIQDVLYEGDDPEIKGIFERIRVHLPTVLDEGFLDSVEREIKGYFLRKGYLEGTFEVDIKTEESEEAVNLTYTYRIEKGTRYRYGRLIIYGNNRTRWREIDYLTVKDQEFYSSVAEEETLWNLIRSEIFTGARLETFIDRDKKRVHRLLEVREDKRGSLELGLGYNTEEKFKVDAGLKLKNLFGFGMINRAFISISEIYRIYEIGLSDHSFFTWKHFIDLSAFRRFEFHESFDLTITGASATVGYRPFRWHTVSLFVSSTENEVEGTEPGTYRLNRYGILLVREVKDDLMNPRNMHHISLRLSRAERDRDYTRIEANAFLLREILSGLSVNGRLAGGQVGEDAPIFDRFFLGGLRNMRGYNFESIGYPLGGGSYYFSRLEIMVRVISPLWVAVYTESGNVAENLESAFRYPKFDVGTAIGIDSPAGFIRLDVARALTPIEQRVPFLRVYLSIGYIY